MSDDQASPPPEDASAAAEGPEKTEQQAAPGAAEVTSEEEKKDPWWRCDLTAGGWAVPMFDKLLGWARRTFPPETFRALSSGAVRSGHVALLAVQILCVVLGLAAAVRLGSAFHVLVGLGLALWFGVLQYSANRFLDAGDALIDSSPSRMGSAAFPDCYALLFEVAGILLFLQMLARGRLSLAFVGLGLWGVCEAVACTGLHPEMTNTSKNEAVGAGEEAIGILSFCIKSVVRTVPIVFGICTILGGCALFFGIFAFMRTGETAPLQPPLRMVSTGALLPIVVYLLFAFYHLILDFLRGIITLRGPGNPPYSA